MGELKNMSNSSFIIKSEQAHLDNLPINYILFGLWLKLSINNQAFLSLFYQKKQQDVSLNSKTFIFYFLHF